MCEVGERTGIRFLVYNPITWARFFFSGRRSGQVFATAITEVFPTVRSVLDVGAGTGGYVVRFRQAGFAAEGLEYSSVGRALARAQGVRLELLDCSRPAGMPDLPKVDLAYSIEVAEHLPEALADQFVGYLGGRADLVIFSAAFPGQGGQGHINEQPKEYWRSKFEASGFVFLPAEAEQLSAVLCKHGFRGWFPKNLQVFKKRGACSD